jgi:hypothetical protein
MRRCRARASPYRDEPRNLARLLHDQGDLAGAAAP